ncbi:MAG TPA: S26 family signal peptidase [Gemmata sp.]|nr:S26 family signal peptidase [Gemmata sp.]
MSATAVAPTKEKTKKPHHPRDPAREVIETIVFVVVLVLLLKLFVTEAFVIPTGSMAETLYGYQKPVICPKCGHEFPVNAHDEEEGRPGDHRRIPVAGFTCPNCRYQGSVEELQPAPKNRSGDRVLVLKPLFHIRDPNRGDVVVFKYPEKPQDQFEAQNYIKRAMGFGGETIAIFRGDLYVTKSLDYPERDLYPLTENPLDLWEPKYMYSNMVQGPGNPKALKLFDTSRAAGFPTGKNGFGTGGFEIARKGEGQLLADRRIVWDNDRQPEVFAKEKIPPRWYDPEGWTTGWKPDNELQPKSFAHNGGGEQWIRYRHFPTPWTVPPSNVTDENAATSYAQLAQQSPSFIDNFLGYNSGREADPVTGRITSRERHYEKAWVGDLILECEAELGGDGQVTMELSRGVNRFRAVFAAGTVRLEREGVGSETFGKPQRPCKVAAGKYKLRFANVDGKLWVWVDDKLIDFGAEGEYLPPTPEEEANFTDSAPDAMGRRAPHPGVQPEGWTYKNDVDSPASIGAKGQVTVRAIKLHRDIFYAQSSADWSDPTIPGIYYVQPGHYLCLGDNSAQSSDSRAWGTVPQRLMLGKAVFVFFPISRVGFIK